MRRKLLLSIMVLSILLSSSLVVSVDAASMWSRTYGGSGNDCAYSLVATADWGYALAGRTDWLGAGGEDFWLVKTDIFGNMEWSRTYGGTGNDCAYSLVTTVDGGYAIAGDTGSFDAGSADFWLVKTDGLGNMQWNQTFGGASADGAYSLVATSDGGYAIAGYTNSFGAGSGDFWLVKTDANGVMQWNRTYGGEGDDVAHSLIATADGGYAVAGNTKSFGAGSDDCWLVKTDAFGNVEWNQTYGGNSGDWASSLVAAPNGGYTILGLTYYLSGEVDDLTPPKVWLVKTDALGNLQWFQIYASGISDEKAYSLIVTDDGGYTMAGIMAWNFFMGERYYHTGLFKLDEDGYMLWNKTYYGGAMYEAHSVVQASDGGYALAGNTDPVGYGEEDFWIIKASASGQREWGQTYGATGNDCAYSLVATSDGGYTVAGSTGSFGSGGNDAWLVKTDLDGNMQWNRTYGGAFSDGASSLVETVDGGYAFAGYTSSFGAGSEDFWLVKIDAAGNVQWSKTYGGGGSDVGCSLIVTSDGGYAIAGYTRSFGGGVYDFWLVKTDAAGNLQWNRTYGGLWGDYAYSMVEAPDGGYTLFGLTWSRYEYVIDLTPPEVWLVKTDTAGNMQWNQTYGFGAYDSGGYSLIAATDGGYALVSGSQLVKTDAFGNVQWNMTSEEAMWGVFRSLTAASDGGYVLAGESSPFDAISSDFWLVKTDAFGNVEWNRTYGGVAYDAAFSVVEALDGGYALCGFTMSFDAGSQDFWLVKTDEFGVVPEFSSWLVPALVLTATAFIIINKKRLLRKHSEKP